MKKCICGFCDEESVLYRGKYRGYAFGHNKVEWHRKKYIETYGTPTCIVCGMPSGFKRKVPNKYCSNICSGKVNGFSKPSTQEKIHKVIRQKYGVENASQIPISRRKISVSKLGKIVTLTDEWKHHIGEGIRRKWKSLDYRKKTSNSIKKSLNTPEQKMARSKLMKERWNSENGRNDLLDKLLNGLKNRLSKLHQKIRDELKLGINGFVSEQRVGRYLVDELNEPKKLIVEINGDYVHANPKIYKPDDIIYLPGNSYTATEKWESDTIKRHNLEKMGYIVITIWETDEIEKYKQTIKCS